MMFFTADQHFGHSNIIKMCNRPFTDVNDMNEFMIAAWNNRIKGDDTVYIVGDLFFRCKNPEEILQRLKGKKRLIIGNHDSYWIGKVDYHRYFVSIDNYLEISDGAHAITLCHYPMVTWKHPARSFMIHGHIHANTDAEYWHILRDRENILNAGVDINNFAPVIFEELVENNNKFKALAR